MKKLLVSLVLAVLSLGSQAQMMHGNTFPFWNVTGDLTVGGTTTLATAPVITGLTASQAVFTDGSKNLVSNAVTGTGSVVMSASPTLTGTIGAANQTLSGTLGVTGVATFTAAPVFSSATASQAMFTDGSKGLVSNAITGTGNVVMSASPTLSGSVLLGAGTVANPSIAFSGDPNTGLISSAANAVGVVTDGAERWVFNASGGLNCATDGGCIIGNGAADPDSLSVVTAVVIRTAASPASNAACTAGTLYWDASYLYVCTATGVVKRAALTGGY